jgi:hypothetical protein
VTEVSLSVIMLMVALILYNYSTRRPATPTALGKRL